MNEHLKIAEARHFLSRLSKTAATPQEFKFEVSAFLSSSRSALQYAREEAMNRPGGQIWFDNHAKASDVRYLKDKRDTNIHVEPVIPQLGLAVSDSLAVSASFLGATLTDVNGCPSPRLVAQNDEVIHIATHTRASTPEPTSVSVIYRFKDWTGPEDVYTLCERYLAQIEAIVADGRSKGFLTPRAA